MLKSKQKRYNTKKRKIERTKWHALLLVSVIGLVGIAVSYIGTITPFQYEIAKAMEEPLKSQNKASEVAEKSLQQHIFDLLVNEGGMSWEEAQRGLMIVNCESRFDAWAIGDNGLSRGLWQIHKPSHPNITSECAFDAYCSTREAIKIYQKWGNTFDAWSCNKLI